MSKPVRRAGLCVFPIFLAGALLVGLRLQAMDRPEGTGDRAPVLDGDVVGPAMGGRSDPLPRDYWVTRAYAPAGGTYQDLTVPASFFGPGCDAFAGRVYFEGSPLDPQTTGSVDTVLVRSADPVAPDDPVGAVGTVSLELEALSLVSVDPITVTCGGQSEEWMVHVGLSPTSPPAGSLTATKTQVNGGTFDSTIHVQPLLTFTKVVDPSQVLVMDTGGASDPIVLTATGTPFVHAHSSAGGDPVETGATFVPGVVETVPGPPGLPGPLEGVGADHFAGGHQHHVVPPPCVPPCGVCEECVNGVCVPIQCGVCEKCVNGVCVDILTGLDEAGQQAEHRANPQCVTLPGVSALLKDCLLTPAGGVTTFHIFGTIDSPAIPADFFAPGSDPFVGTVELQGTPITPADPECPGADTVIQRSASPFVPCDPPGGPPVTVDIEIVALSLVSVAPMTVTFNGGQNPEDWDVVVDLSAVGPPLGTLTATKTHCNGGTFSSNLNVQPRFTFIKVAPPNQGQTLPLDTGLVGTPPVVLQTVGSTWIHGILTGVPALDFIPGLDDPTPTQVCALPDEPGTELTCDDGIDNDCDGLTDCADTVDCPPAVPPCP